jgi:hypothetical protein
VQLIWRHRTERNKNSFINWSRWTICLLYAKHESCICFQWERKITSFFFVASWTTQNGTVKSRGFFKSILIITCWFAVKFWTLILFFYSTQLLIQLQANAWRLQSEWTWFAPQTTTHTNRWIKFWNCSIKYVYLLTKNSLLISKQIVSFIMSFWIETNIEIFNL